MGSKIKKLFWSFKSLQKNWH